MILADIKEGDKLYVKCPYTAEHWQEEVVKSVITGEDGYKGSERWYMRITTDHSINTCSSDQALEGWHWPILITSIGTQSQDMSEASSGIWLKVSANKVIEVNDDSKENIIALIDIIKKSTLVDLRKKEPLPNEADIVGMGNHEWEYKHFYEMKHTTHDTRNNTYGGYTSLDKEGEPQGWWTMNYNFAKFRSEYMFIVPDRDSGIALAKLLNLIGNDWLDTYNAIRTRENEIARLTAEMNLIKEVEGCLKEKLFAIISSSPSPSPSDENK